MSLSLGKSQTSNIKSKLQILSDLINDLSNETNINLIFFLT